VTLKKIRLELARTKEFPEGNPRCGYEFTAPLAKDGHLDLELYRQEQDRLPGLPGARRRRRARSCTCKDRWVFAYAPGSDDDEPAFKLDRHSFAAGDMITEHDGVTRPFKIASV
jgi:hypothetical protein